MVSVVKRMTRQYIVSTPFASIIIRRDDGGDATLDISEASGRAFKTPLRKQDAMDLFNALAAALEDWA